VILASSTLWPWQGGCIPRGPLPVHSYLATPYGRLGGGTLDDKQRSLSRGGTCSDAAAFSAAGAVLPWLARARVIGTQ